MSKARTYEPNRNPGYVTMINELSDALAKGSDHCHPDNGSGKDAIDEFYLVALGVIATHLIASSGMTLRVELLASVGQAGLRAMFDELRKEVVRGN